MWLVRTARRRPGASVGERMTLRSALVALGVLLLVACSCAKKDNQVQDTAAPPPPPVLSPDAVTIDPQGLASVVKGEVIHATANRPGTKPFLNGEPEHLRFRFDQDSLTPGYHFTQRQVLIYPITAYRNLFQGTARDSFNGEIAKLQDLLDARPSRVNDTIPLFPKVDGHQLYNARVEYLELNGGSGIRFLTRYDDGVSPGIFYAFQGIVGDRYIAVFWPIVPQEQPTMKDAPRIASFLEGLTQEEFTPTLETIDKIVESIQIKEPGTAPPPPQ